MLLLPNQLSPPLCQEPEMEEGRLRAVSVLPGMHRQHLAARRAHPTLEIV